MDAKAAEQGRCGMPRRPEPCRSNPSADRDQRLPLGAALRRRAGPRPARPLGARGDRPPYRVRLLDPERPADICSSSRSTRCRCYQRRQGHLFETGAIVQYIGEQDERLLPRDRRAAPGHPVDLCGAQQRRAGDPQPAAHRPFLRGEEWAEAAPAGRRGVRQAEAQARVRLARRQGLAGGRPLHHRRPDDGHRAAHPAPYRPGRALPQPRGLCEARRSAAGIPAALADQLAVFKENEPAAAPRTDEEGEQK